MTKILIKDLRNNFDNEKRSKLRLTRTKCILLSHSSIINLLSLTKITLFLISLFIYHLLLKTILGGIYTIDLGKKSMKKKKKSNQIKKTYKGV